MEINGGYFSAICRACLVDYEVLAYKASLLQIFFAVSPPPSCKRSPTPKTEAHCNTIDPPGVAPDLLVSLGDKRVRLLDLFLGKKRRKRLDDDDEDADVHMGGRGPGKKKARGGRTAVSAENMEALQKVMRAIIKQVCEFTRP